MIRKEVTHERSNNFTDDTGSDQQRVHNCNHNGFVFDYIRRCIAKFDALLAGFAFMAFALIVAAQGVHPHPKQYKITVDNTVSYNEFTAKYNIIETDGKIITVEEKDNGKNSD